MDDTNTLLHGPWSLKPFYTKHIVNECSRRKCLKGLKCQVKQSILVKCGDLFCDCVMIILK